MRQRQHPSAGREQVQKALEIHFAIERDGNGTNHGAGLARHDLPRHQVGVVLKARHENLVAGLQEGAAPSLCDEIDRFGSAPGEDDFAFAARIDEALQFVSSSFEGVGGALRQRVHAAMDVRVVVAVIVRLGVDDRAWVLCRGAVVQIRQRFAIHLLVQDGEIGA